MSGTGVRRGSEVGGFSAFVVGSTDTIAYSEYLSVWIQNGRYVRQLVKDAGPKVLIAKAIMSVLTWSVWLRR